MIPILFEKTESTFLTNGICRLRDAISAVVTEERNGIFELSIEYPIDGANYEKIIPGRIIAVTHDDTGDLQPFDIVSYSKPINGVVTFHAVHISYRLNGNTVSATNITSLSAALTMLGNATPTPAFTFESDFTSSAFMAAADGIPRSVRQMLGGVEGSILDTYGGEFEFDKFRVILHSARGRLVDFSIRYGVNLVDYNEDTDFSDTYNAVIPFWGKGEEIIKASKVSAGVQTYTGREICVPLDLSDKFDTKPTAAQLRTKAAQMIKQANLPRQNIQVDFVRLQDIGEYSQFEALLQCRLCDSVNVIFPKYGMQGRYKIVKTVYNVLSGRFDEMELGDLKITLSEALGITEALSNGGGKTAFDLIWNSWYSDVPITNSNQGWRLHSSLSVTVPSGHVYIVQAQTTFVSGKPTGIGFHTTTTLSQTTPITFYGDGTNYCAMGTFMLTPGTWYLCDCRATAPSQANAYYVRGLDVTY